jgi:Taurine catabolism dioxygenase TauD, TfdA family
MMKSFGLDAVNISFLSSDDGSPTKTLPLVMSPCWETSVAFLCSWLENNCSFLDEMMLKFGAVLVRGFDISSCNDFERAALSFQPGLNDCYHGTSPRQLQDGTKFVFSSADAPSTFPIAQHLEMSFLPAPPCQLFFGCMKAPTSSGGETALCNFWKVYWELSPELHQKFFDKKLCITRTHKKVVSNSFFSFDVAGMKCWPELFGTSDKTEVERICKAEGIPVHWDNDDTFGSIIELELFQHPPITKVSHCNKIPESERPLEANNSWYCCCTRSCESP